MSPNPDEEKSDFEKVISALNEHQVEFLIIGGYAVVHYGYMRTTEDLDIYIRPTPKNAQRAVRAIAQLGFTGAEISAEVFTLENGLSLGVAPMTVDLIAYIPGVDPEKLWSSRQAGRFGDQDVNFMSREDLINNKRAVGRAQDLADVQKLEVAKQHEKKHPENED